MFVVCGFLNAIPLPADLADALLTHRAIGWDPASELAEVERLVRRGGVALHQAGMPYPAAADAPLHQDLLSWGYAERAYEDGESQYRKYDKEI